MAAPVLKPLSLGEVLDISFGLYRTLFTPLFLVTLATRAVPLLIEVYVEASGGLLAQPLLYAVNLVLNVVLGAVAAAASTFVIAENYLGRPLTAGAAFARSTPFIGRLILVALLSTLLLGFGMLLLVIPFFILLPGLVLATPALVLEDLPGAVDALGRAWSLSRGFRFRVFVAMMVVFTLIVIPFIALGMFMVSQGTLEATTALNSEGLLAVALAALIQTLIYPLLYAVLTVLYYDLRVRKEAYDLEVLAADLGAA
ncbi:MAG: hypothetical protein IPK12_15630 [Gemmatimonadetes bacterium]|nr:hypothetical protein [Gemmatimonadota bacterium]